MVDIFLDWLILKDKKQLEIAQNWLDDQLREIESEAKSTIEGEILENAFRLKCLELETVRFGYPLEIALNLIRKDKKQENGRKRNTL